MRPTEIFTYGSRALTKRKLVRIPKPAPTAIRRAPHAPLVAPQFNEQAVLPVVECEADRDLES